MQLVSKAKYRVYLECTALGNSLQSLEGHDPLGTGQEMVIIAGLFYVPYELARFLIGF